MKSWLRNVKRSLEVVWYPCFVLAGRRPWSFGYVFYRQRAIFQAIRDGFLKGSQLPAGYGFRIDERVIEYPWLFSRLPSGPGDLLDAGAALNHDFLLRREPLASKTLSVCTLSAESEPFRKRGIAYVFEDLRHTSFSDRSFDYVVSISTIEHIGLDNTMLYTSDTSKREAATDTYMAAIREYKRIVKTGGTVFISFPYGRYENHGWFQVFDSAMVDRVVKEFTPSAHVEFYFKYEPNGWRRAEPRELWAATFFDIRKKKGYDPDFAAGARGLACLEMTK
jgi:SAM-dependent methyltransferase